MPLTRIRQTAIGNDSITTAKLDDTSGGLTLPGVQYVRVPIGTAAQRPTGASGYLRFNTDVGVLEQWNTNTNAWAAVDSPPIIISVAYSSSNTATDPAGGETITLTGSNFQTGATVTIGGTSATSVTVVSTTSITFTTPAKTAGDYDIVVTNSNGLSATSTNGISYNGTPSFTTAAGNVGSISEDIAMSTITIVAAEPDGGTLAYSITSGALPTGVSMSSAGAITGTPNVNVTSNTTYNFTVTATDDENQTNSRAFNLIVLRPIYATQLANSLKFEHGDSANLSRTISTSATLGTKGTVSAWIKRSILGNGTGNNQYWLHSGTGTDNSGHMDLKFNTTDVLSIGRYSDTPYDGGSAVYRDTSAWLHIVVSFDSTSATPADRQIKVWVNGVQKTDGTFGAIGQNDVFPFTKSGNTIFIGKHATVGRPFNGYIADFHLIDGQALTPTSFAEEYYGVWAPKTYSGTFGNNGFKLTFANSSDLGNDVSGNNNDYTPNNFTVSDHVIDSPTNNFATLNPLTMGSYNTLNEGNLRLAGVYGADLSGVCATQFFSSGKWYWEVRVNGIGTYPYVGIATPKRILVNAQGTYYTIAWNASGSNQTNSSDLGTITGVNVGSFANGDIIMLALDVDARKLWWGENGTWANSGNPAAGTGEVASWTVDEDVSPVIMGYSSDGIGTIMNFGQDSTFAGNETVASNADSNGIGEFQYSPPTNFLAMTSKNLTESTINTTLDDRPEDYFSIVDWSANGSGAVDRSITGLDFQPDFVWSKTRDQGYHHALFDSLRGPSSHLATDRNNAENTVNGGRLSSFDSNGFTWTANGSTAQWYNEANREYIAWCWKAGGAPTATNSAGAGNVPTSGSVMIDGVASTSALAGTNPVKKLSANTKAGFSIVNYTGDTTNTTKAHGLGKTPSFVIVKKVDATGGWVTWHKDLPGSGTAKYMYLDSVSGTTAGTTAGYWSGGFDTNIFGGWASGGDNNNTGTDYIAYVWAEIEGFSKFGSYSGNASADGPYIHCGFKPAFVMMANTAINVTWYMIDNKIGNNEGNRTPARFLMPSNANAQDTPTGVDFLSNGFKITTTGGGQNGNAQTHIFMAFAEDPFKYSEAK